MSPVRIFPVTPGVGRGFVVPLRPGNAGGGKGPDFWQSRACTALIASASKGASGDLIKIVWHDGIGMSLYAKRLEHAVTG